MACLIARADLFRMALPLLWRAVPLPFLVKSDVHRVLGLVVTRSVHESFVPLLFAGVVLGSIACWGNQTKKQKRKTLWLLISLILIPTAFFWHMRLDQNVENQLFYYLPLAAALLLAVNWPALVEKQKFFPVACVLGWWLYWSRCRSVGSFGPFGTCSLTE